MRALITFLWGSKDGGPESNVRMWGVECKWLGSILVLHFAPGSREAFHSHAFNAVSWVLSGELLEEVESPVTIPGLEHCKGVHIYTKSRHAVITRPVTFHKVSGGQHGAWVFTLRGRWHKTWKDGQPENPDTLTSGRRKVQNNRDHNARMDTLAVRLASDRCKCGHGRDVHDCGWCYAPGCSGKCEP